MLRNLSMAAADAEREQGKESGQIVIMHPTV
jgi:hypothetical protein